MHNDSGKIGEDYAADYLLQNGYQILERNYHCRFGEIDIIVRNDQYLIFTEVKTRNEKHMVSPLEAVTVGKQKKLYRTALVYLQSHPTQLQPRFDVIGIITNTNNAVLSMEHIENAFYGGGYY